MLKLNLVRTFVRSTLQTKQLILSGNQLFQKLFISSGEIDKFSMIDLKQTYRITPLTLPSHLHLSSSFFKDTCLRISSNVVICPSKHVSSILLTQFQTNLIELSDEINSFSSIEHILFTSSWNKSGNVNLNGSEPNHLSCQNNVLLPFFTTRKNKSSKFKFNKRSELPALAILSQTLDNLGLANDEEFRPEIPWIAFTTFTQSA